MTSTPFQFGRPRASREARRFCARPRGLSSAGPVSLAYALGGGARGCNYVATIVKTFYSNHTKVHNNEQYLVEKRNVVSVSGQFMIIKIHTRHL